MYGQPTCCYRLELLRELSSEDERPRWEIGEGSPRPGGLALDETAWKAASDASLALALANPTLRRIGVAYGLSFATEFGIWLALLVFAYARGGPTGALLTVIVQLLPTGLTRSL